MDSSGNTIVVTGGSSGIGLAIAEALSARGNTLILIGREADRLAAAKQRLPGAHAVLCDVTDEDAVRVTFAELFRRFPAINIVVNAAGTSRACRFAEDPLAVKTARSEIQTNLFGTALVSAVVLPKLLQQPKAALVVVSSGIAYAPHLLEPTHSATKAGLHALCRCLRYQLRHSGVRVLEVCPPLTDTPLTAHTHGPKLKPEQVAAGVVSGIERETPEIRLSFVRLLPLLCRISPWLAERVVTRSARDDRLPPERPHAAPPQLIPGKEK